VFALVKVFGAFAVVVFMIRMKLPLGISLITGALLIAFLFGMTPLAAGAAVLDICLDDRTGRFVLLIAQILALSLVLEKSGQISRLTESLRTFVTNRKLASATLPAIVGFLPMPGGALFSAPMVKAATDDMILDNHKKVEVNHWFRHVWEYSWPLYPGIIYTAGILDLEIKQLLVMQFPLTVMAIIMGFVFVMRGVKIAPGSAAPLTAARHKAVARFLLDFLPFIMIIALYLVFSLDLLWSVLAALIFTIVINTVRKKVNPLKLAKSILTSTHYLNFIIMAYGVMLFGEMLGPDKSGAITEMSGFFNQSQVPELLIVIVLPCIIGFVAGITIVYCTTTFPLLLALPVVAANPVPYIVLAFTAGFMGTMLSPIHACLALSSEYFQGGLGRVILRLTRPAIGVMAMGFALWLLYQHWQPF
jgi:integral membrane protein (TIGR00529 family)